MRPQLLRTLLASLVLALLLAGPGIAPQSGPLDRLEQPLYDWRMRLDQRPGQDPRVVILDIDEASLAAEGRWPWPRERIAALVDRLFDEYGVGLLAFDVLFAEPDRLQGLARVQEPLRRHYPLLAEPLARLMAQLDPDLRLARSLEGRPVVLGYAFAATGSHRTGALPPPLETQAPPDLMASLPTPTGYSANLPLLQEYAPAGGFFDNPLVDSDGGFRRVPLVQRFEGALYPALSLAVMATLLGSEQLTLVPGGDSGVLEHLDLDGLRIPVDAQGAVRVPYRGPQGSFPYLSAHRVLSGEADPARLEGAIVLLGTSAAGLLDLRSTPVQNAYPGVEIHANLIAGLLDESLLQQPDYLRGANLVQCLLIGLLLVLLPSRLGAIRTTLLALALAAAVVAGNLYLWQQHQQVLPLAPPLLVLLVLYLVQLLLGYAFETRRHRRLSQQFGQYVPPQLVDELQQQEGDLALGGDSREMTVLFADIRDFTRLSETLSPQQLSRLMNLYLTPMTEVIHRHRGTIDKYIGDAVMAFWGAPLRDSEHGAHALAAALGMLEQLEAVNRALAAENLPPVRIGIGLNSGEMSVGNMGSRFRMAYTVLGDAVNLGSRLEGLTKFYGVELVVSEAVIRQAPQQPVRLLDRVRVKGKEEPVAIYEPLAADPAFLAPVLERHRSMLEAYREQRWDEAETLCHELRQGPLGAALYDLYLARIAAFRQHPPGPGWDGVHRLDHK